MLITYQNLRRISQSNILSKIRLKCPAPEVVFDKFFEHLCRQLRLDLKIGHRSDSILDPDPVVRSVK
jgi:hypothetical protein